MNNVYINSITSNDFTNNTETHTYPTRRITNTYHFHYEYIDNATADAYLMTFVNFLGVVTFSSIVLYHFITAPSKDAEA